METKLILGAGISGLTYAYYNKDYKIISTDLGGKLNREYLACTVLLHQTQETQRLLKDLGISVEPVAHLVRYFFQGRLQEEVPALVYQRLVAKKLTPWYALPLPNVSVPSVKTSWSTPTSYIPVYRLRTSHLVKQIATHVQWIEDRVVRITPTHIVTKKGAVYEYSDLVSTIPAPEFWKLYQQSREFNYFAITYVYSDTNPVPDDPDTMWDLIYFVDNDIKYTRVNRDRSAGSYLYEFTGEISEKELNGLYPKLKVKEYFVQKYGVIVTDSNNIPPSNVRFLGRFAKWDHRYRIQDAIRESVMRCSSTSFAGSQDWLSQNTGPTFGGVK